MAILAAAYVRMSTDRQEASPAEQKDAIAALAKRERYKIVKWYSDEGVSGAADTRPGFELLQADAELGKFDRVLCWDISRLTRQDMFNACHAVKPLKDIGVTLHTVEDGYMDWNDVNTHFLFGPKFSMSHAYLKQLSANVTRSIHSQAKEGQWVCGKPPLGYAIGPDKRLHPGLPEDVATVRAIFDLYAHRGLSLRQKRPR